MEKKNNKPRILSYDEAKAFLKPLGLKSKRDYIKWYRENKPDFLPEDPETYYSNLDLNMN